MNQHSHQTAPTEAAFIQADVRRDDKGERS